MRISRLAILLFLPFFSGCESNLQRIKPLERVEIWVPDDPADTLPATTLASTLPTSPDSQPATRPGHFVVRMVDPNQSFRFVYQATYQNIWQQSIDLLTRAGFSLDLQDYRRGVLGSKPLPSSQLIEFWKPAPNLKDAVENSINSQRRIARITISKVPGKPDFHEIAIQILVERESNPTEQLEGPVFVEGSGFGRNKLALRSDYVSTDPELERWYIVGHDPDLENKFLSELVLRL